MINGAETHTVPSTRRFREDVFRTRRVLGQGIGIQGSTWRQEVEVYQSRCEQSEVPVRGSRVRGTRASPRTRRPPRSRLATLVRPVARL